MVDRSLEGRVRTLNSGITDDHMNCLFSELGILSTETSRVGRRRPVTHRMARLQVGPARQDTTIIGPKEAAEAVTGYLRLDERIREDVRSKLYPPGDGYYLGLASYHDLDQIRGHDDKESVFSDQILPEANNFGSAFLRAAALEGATAAAIGTLRRLVHHSVQHYRFLVGAARAAREGIGKQGRRLQNLVETYQNVHGLGTQVEEWKIRLTEARDGNPGYALSLERGGRQRLKEALGYALVVANSEEIAREFERYVRQAPHELVAIREVAM